jgi:hypothetical protein
LAEKNEGGKGNQAEICAAYPWAMAPRITARKPVATAIATFVSTDKFIIFPFNYGDNPVAPFFWIWFSQSLRISAWLWMPGAEEDALAARNCEVGMERLGGATRLCWCFGVAGIEHVAIEGMELLGKAT